MSSKKMASFSFSKTPKWLWNVKRKVHTLLIDVRIVREVLWGGDRNVNCSCRPREGYEGMKPKPLDL